MSVKLKEHCSDRFIGIKITYMNQIFPQTSENKEMEPPVFQVCKSFKKKTVFIGIVSSETL